MPHQTIALGGWLYGIGKWLPNAHHINCPVWGFTERWCRDFAASLRRPVVLIGFSEGANAAMAIAAHSPMVVRAFIHSCENKKPSFNHNCQYSFYVTLGDTTPTFEGTCEVAEDAASDGATASLSLLEYQDFENPTLFEKRFLAPRQHIFHNALPLIGLQKAA